MAQTKAGAEKVAARKAGLTIEEFRERIASGQKRCTSCDRWRPQSTFSVDASRGDGRDASCRDCKSARWRAAYKPRPRKRGRRYAAARDGDRLQARGRVNHLVNIGVLDDPNSAPCTDCDHRTGDGVRHEYDHHLGYAAEHHESVQAVCTRCHAKREKARGVHARRTRDTRGRFNEET